MLLERTQPLLHGPLKHLRAAALLAALVPLASVVAVPAEAQEMCASAGVCGFVWYDSNHNGIQDPGEPAIVGAVVTLGGTSQATNPDGFYYFAVPPGSYDITVQIPPGTEPSPANVGSNDAVDSDGTRDEDGSNSVGTVVLIGGENTSTDFGFGVSQVATNPGTGTPGYWKNHPEAWPVIEITVGGVVYTKAQAIGMLETPGKDKTFTMFSSLVPAMLNVIIGNDPNCVADTIDDANAWMVTYGPVGRKVYASSLAWKVGEPLHRIMDNYNNGMLCAPHRD